MALACFSSPWARALSKAGAVAPVHGTLTVDLAAPSMPWNRMIFGQFLEHFHRQVYGGVFEPGSPLADRTGFRLDVVEALRELKVPIVRWPGGCFVSGYHWQDGVGKRSPAYNKAWGVEDSNTFGTDEFVQWCRMIGAEPYICTNAGTGTAEEMSDWVEYCNLPTQGKYARMRIANGHTEPYNVRYWSIGNENYFSTEIGSKTIEEWESLVRTSAQLMRAVDPEIQLLAAATVKGDWTARMLREAGKALNYISIHGYWDALWQRNTVPADYPHCVARSSQPEQQIEQAIALVDNAGFGGRINIAFDEWNLRGWHHPGFPGGGANKLDLIRERDENDRNEVYTMADAVFSASFLHGCLRHAKQVQMACMAPVVNARGPLFVHPKGIVRRTTFHVLRMYSDLLQPNVLANTVAGEDLVVGENSVPVLDAVTSRSADGRRVTLALINRHPSRPALWKLDVRGSRLPAQCRLTVLSGETPDAFNDVSNPGRVRPETATVPLQNDSLVIPAHSVCMAEFSL